MKTVKRRTLAWTINIALPITTVVVLFMGFKAYTKLEQMVEALEESARPNYNLLVLNEVSFYINEMERTMETYRSEPRPGLMRNFDAALDESLFLVDSLKNKIQDEDVIERYDSLSTLVNEWAKVQTQIGAINSDILESTLDDLAVKIENLHENIEEDTLDEEKENFFKRIFGGRRENDTSSRPSQSERLQQEILVELKNARDESLKQDDALKTRLANLNHEAAILQDSIVVLINEMQSFELEKDNQNVLNVEQMAKNTNQEIVVFSTLTSLLLLITIITQLNYLARNKKYQQALQSAKKNAEELAKTKERFLANMSHEIRTPMNAISGFTNQLLKTDMSAEQRDQLEVVKSSSDHLIHLLNDILDLSKLQANKVELNKEIFNVKDTLFEVIRIFEDKASTKGIKLKTQFESVPKYVSGDPHRLRQMITNLIHNSIKYTEDGSITLSAAVVEKDSDEVTLKVSVKDTGKGIPKDRQRKIFKEFEQANGTDQKKGTGLGLAITRMLLKLHGGRLDIDSEEGKGTEIMLYIPYKIGKPSAKQDSEEIKKIILRDLNILVADDEPFNLKLLEAVFKDHEVNVVSANDGTTAVDALETDNFDIAILDVKMPGYTGFEVVDKIRRAKAKNSKIPMLALTATISDHEKEMSRDYGFNTIMRKPFDENEFLETIQALTASSKSTSKKKLNKAPHSQKQKEKLYDLSTLKSIGDKDFVDEMINTFRTSASKSIENLKKAVELKIRKGIREEAHKMLPPARHLSATSLVNSIEKLQKMADGSSFEEIDKQIQVIEDIYTLIKKDLES